MFNLKYFNINEFNNIEKLDDRILTIIDLLREKIGFPIKIISDYREGNSNSYHSKGMALDFVLQFPEPYYKEWCDNELYMLSYDYIEEIIKETGLSNFIGLGFYKDMDRPESEPSIHIDCRWSKSRWWCINKNTQNNNGKDIKVWEYRSGTPNINTITQYLENRSNTNGV